MQPFFSYGQKPCHELDKSSEWDEELLRQELELSKTLPDLEKEHDYGIPEYFSNLSGRKEGKSIIFNLDYDWEDGFFSELILRVPHAEPGETEIPSELLSYVFVWEDSFGNAQGETLEHNIIFSHLIGKPVVNDGEAWLIPITQPQNSAGYIPVLSLFYLQLELAEMGTKWPPMERATFSGWLCYESKERDKWCSTRIFSLQIDSIDFLSQNDNLHGLIISEEEMEEYDINMIEIEQENTKCLTRKKEWLSLTIGGQTHWLVPLVSALKNWDEAKAYLSHQKLLPVQHTYGNTKVNVYSGGKKLNIKPAFLYTNFKFI